MSRAHDKDIEVHKRTMSTARRPVGKGKAPATPMDAPPDFSSTTFSDEYDLCAWYALLFPFVY